MNRHRPVKPQATRKKDTTGSCRGVGKSKKSKSNLSYCQRLAYSLDNINSGCEGRHTFTPFASNFQPGIVPMRQSSVDGSSICRCSNEDDGEALPIPGILRLPIELRQQVFYDIFDDDELVHAPLSKIEDLAQQLSSVCIAFRADLPRVLSQWRRRKGELLQQRAEQMGNFDTYIADMIAPIKANATFLRTYGRYRPRRETDNTKTVNVKGQGMKRLKVGEAGRLLKQIDWNGKDKVF